MASERLRQFGFADAGGSEKKKTATRPARLAEAELPTLKDRDHARYHVTLTANFRAKRGFERKENVTRSGRCRHSINNATRVPQKWCPDDTTLVWQMCYAYQSDSRRVPQYEKNELTLFHETNQKH